MLGLQKITADNNYRHLFSSLTKSMKVEKENSGIAILMISMSSVLNGTF